MLLPPLLFSASSIADNHSNVRVNLLFIAANMLDRTVSLSQRVIVAS